MTEVLDQSRIRAAYRIACDRLLAARHPDGYWEGRLSSSALSTATAISALVPAGQPQDAGMIGNGVQWLATTQNADGGWGDTVDSPSNLATTLLVVSALRFVTMPEAAAALSRAEEYLAIHAGSTPESRVAAITAVYGKDRTFAVPILLNCALSGLVSWEVIPGLPFELAAFPPAMYKALRLHVVSYALPALIAVGLQLHHRHPSRNPLHRQMRDLLIQPALAKLANIQPEHGGFLDATPLTSFVAMSLLPLYGAEQPVVCRCLQFLRQSFRPDGSWPIDTNLSVWMTTSAITALAAGGHLADVGAERTRLWLLERQYQRPHPYTNAAPGGWGWTHSPGGVPDADDTSGAIIALSHLGETDAIHAGARWLRQLQNRDGGWPTFCRGWGSLPFDKSSPDITAHAIRALHRTDPDHKHRATQQAIARGLRYLQVTQRVDGAWVPLWFGNQAAPRQENPVLGTARVLQVYADLRVYGQEAQRAVQYLIDSQHETGGWGGTRGISPTIEETALAVTAMQRWPKVPGAQAAWLRGIAYLTASVEEGSWQQPAPIGLYFASLWYSEELYPIIWTVEALGSVFRQDSQD